LDTIIKKEQVEPEVEIELASEIKSESSDEVYVEKPSEPSFIKETKEQVSNHRKLLEKVYRTERALMDSFNQTKEVDYA
jgi:hypothetical protein